MGFQRIVEHIAHDPRLHPRPSFFHIDLQNFVEIFRHIDHDATADTLSRQRSAGSAGNKACFVGIGESDQVAQIVLGFGNGYGDG